MSSVAFGALTTRRESSASGKSKSEQPPGLNGYIDTLAALVPAEVLALHALIVSTVTASNSHGQTRITDASTARWAFWLLLGLSGALFVLGRGGTPAPAQAGKSGATATLLKRWEWQDWIRLLIPPAAFACWAMLEPASVWNAVAPRVSDGMRTLIALVGAVVLAAVTKALTTHADKRTPPEGQDQGTPETAPLNHEGQPVQAADVVQSLLEHLQASTGTVSAALPIMPQQVPVDDSPSNQLAGKMNNPALSSTLRGESAKPGTYRVLDLDVARRLTQWKWQT